MGEALEKVWVRKKGQLKMSVEVLEDHIVKGTLRVQ
jgi:hypothetical protein